MRLYTVECSICRFLASDSDPVVAGGIADRHERETGHKGPFVWAREVVPDGR